MDQTNEDSNTINNLNKHRSQSAISLFEQDEEDSQEEQALNMSAQQPSSIGANPAVAAMAAAFAAQQLLASASALCGLDLASLSNFATLVAQSQQAGGTSLAGNSPLNGQQSSAPHLHQTPEQLITASMVAASLLSSAQQQNQQQAQQQQQSPIQQQQIHHQHHHHHHQQQQQQQQQQAPQAQHQDGLVALELANQLNSLLAQAAAHAAAVSAASASSSPIHQQNHLFGLTNSNNQAGSPATTHLQQLQQQLAMHNQQSSEQAAVAAATAALLDKSSPMTTRTATTPTQQHQDNSKQILPYSNNNHSASNNTNHLSLNHLSQHHHHPTPTIAQQQLQQRKEQQENQHHHHHHHHNNNQNHLHLNNSSGNHHHHHRHHNHHHHNTGSLLGGHHHHSSIQTQQQLLATRGYNPLAVIPGEQTEILTPTHLRKAKLMFFYVRYPNSSTLKECFRDVRFNKNNTAQLVKWFSNFREFYYIQMEKFAREAVTDERIQCKEDIQVDFDHELINQLNNHYNKNRHIELPDVFRQVVEETLKHFFDAIYHKRDQEQSWKKAIYKIISRLDMEVPESFKKADFNQMLE